MMDYLLTEQAECLELILFNDQKLAENIIFKFEQIEAKAYKAIADKEEA